jgi:SsrA-binding protein
LTATIPVDYDSSMQKIISKNRKAFHDFEILDHFIAGIALKGHEAKSLRNNGGNFTGSFVSLSDGEVFLKSFNIALYSKTTLEDYEPTKPRKAEILKIASALNTKGVTLVPLAYGLDKGKIKFEIGLARGKKSYDKRHDLKKKDELRRIKKMI